MMVFFYKEKTCISFCYLNCKYFSDSKTVFARISPEKTYDRTTLSFLFILLLQVSFPSFPVCRLHSVVP